MRRFIYLHEFEHLLDERLRVGIKYDFLVDPVALLHDVLQHLVGLPAPLEDADGLPVLVGDGELVDGADAPAPDEDGVRRAREDEVPPRVTEAGVNDDVHVV